jgi:hypothetical protein
VHPLGAHRGTIVRLGGERQHERHHDNAKVKAVADALLKRCHLHALPRHGLEHRRQPRGPVGEDYAYVV